MSVASAQHSPRNDYPSDGPLFDFQPPRPAQYNSRNGSTNSSGSRSQSHMRHQQSMEDMAAQQHDSYNSKQPGMGSMNSRRSMSNINMNMGNSREPPPNDGYDGDPRQTNYYPQQTPPTQLQYRPSSYSDGEQTPPSAGDDDDFFVQGNDDQDFRRSYAAQSFGQQSQRGHSPPPPLLDHSHLRPGAHAALLSHDKTMQLLSDNAKKNPDPEVQFEFAVFTIDASKSVVIPVETPGNIIDVEKAIQERDKYIHEGIALLKRLADRGHAASQYFLADCYANGIGTKDSKQDFDRAYPLFVLAAKHGHPDAAYRAGTCCENGWGCRRESAKAIQFFRKAAASLHPGAMYRLGIAELNGELGLSKRPKEGVKWLKRSAEHATAEFPHALHELALLHERGIENVVFVDYEYAAELLAQAAELGYARSAYRLGECYEYGKMGCPQDAALSIHYYNIAAQQDHRDACFALTAWYLVGSPGVLPQSDTEAFLWAKKAAEAGLAKAMYAVGYFLEVGIGTPPSMNEALIWYQKAAEQGDKRATQRLKAPSQGPIHQPGGHGAILRREAGGSPQSSSKGAKDKDCIIM